MQDPRAQGSTPAGDGPVEGRLESWKRIAAYLKRDVTTVQRWEKREGMPVRRHQHAKQGSVYALRSELDAWWAARSSQLAGQTDNAAPVARLRWRNLWPWAAATAVAILVAAVWYAEQAGYFWRDPLAEAKVTPLTDFTGTGEAAAISRDGRMVAFLAERDGHRDAWLTEIGGSLFRNLTNGQIRDLSNPFVRTLNFTPDGSLVSIWSRNADGSHAEDIKLMGAPTAGGPLQLYMKDAAEFDWSPDGRTMVYHTTAPGDPLFLRTTGEADAHQIYVASPGVHCHFPTFSPDGEFIYFIRGEPPAYWDVWRLPRAGGEPERLTFHNSRVSSPVLLDSQTLIYLATDADGSGPWLYEMNTRLKVTHRVSFGLERYTSLSASANGKRIVAAVAHSRSELWRAPIHRDASLSNNPVPVEPAAQSASSPRFGPGFIAYVSVGGARQGVWRLVNGAASEIWADTGPLQIGAPAISPDGRRIAFTVQKQGASHLYVVDSDGEHPKSIAEGLALRGDLAWTPDGQALIGAIVQNGEPRLARIFFDHTPPRPLLSEYSIDPAWSPDGKFLIYSGADVGTTFPLRALSTDGRPYPTPSLNLTRGARRVVFAGRSGSLVILRGDIGHKNFWLRDPKTGTEQQLTDLPSNFVIGDFDVSPDGSEIIFDRLQSSSTIALIDRAS